MGKQPVGVGDRVQKVSVISSTSEAKMASREIKFRAWDHNEKEMVEWWRLRRTRYNAFHADAVDDGHGAFLDMFSDTGITLMQFTGLKDRNGKEIYEGDIVVTNEYPFYDTGVPNYRAVVEWEGVGFAYTLNCVNPEKRGISHGICQSMDDDMDWEVIGNIHEHPELLNATG